MKIVEGRIILHQPGNVKLIPEDLDDLWLVDSIISVGDVISSETTRKVHNLNASSGGKKNPSRVTTELEIKISAVDYQKNSSVLRVSGKSISANEHVKIGMFHTLALVINKEFILRKKQWDEEEINALDDASNSSSKADLSVILLDEGLAHVFLVGKSNTTLATSIYATGNKFFENVYQAFVKHIDFETVRCVVIGSPGSTKEEFRRYLLSEAQKQKIKSVSNNKSRLLLINTTSANEGSLNEVLQDEKVMNTIRDTKTAIELKAFKEFSDLLQSNPDRACYGPKSIDTAHEWVAVETLLITDDLFKSEEIKARQKYIELVKSVKNAGGNAFVFSSQHVYGKQLAQLTGIAAILRFPLPDLDEIEL